MVDSKTYSIAELEQAIVLKRYDLAEPMLYSLISAFVENKVEFSTAPFDRELSKPQQVIESYQIIEKLATLITTWFSDPNYNPTEECYSFVCLQKSFINNLFVASSYHSTDHILVHLGLVGRTDYSPAELRRLLFVVTLESAFDIPWALLFQHLPNEAIKAFSGQLRSINLQMSARAKRSISYLVEGAKAAPAISTDEVQNLSPLVSSYFNCSNLADTNKYEIKKWIVSCFEKFMSEFLSEQTKQEIESVKQAVNKDKPVILVFHEFYHEKHAMYRGHQPRIASLKEHFHVIGMGLESQFDELGQEDFDGVKVFKKADKLNVEMMIKEIIKVKPDVIYYPSVGMSMFLPLITTQRLAPIQIASAGHPSSTYMENIDYFHCLDVGYDKQSMEQIISEKWLPVKRTALYRKEIELTLSQSDLDTSKSNVIVNGVIQKISHEQLQICQQITEQSQSDVVFHFFMAHPKQDIEYYASLSLLRRFLPSARLHGFSSYDEYMSILKDADFAIGTYPFGGTNSNIDLIRLNKPKLFVVSTDDISGLTDLDIWQSVDYLKGQCGSIEELIKRAATWVDKPDTLQQEVDQMTASNLNQRILESPDERVNGELVDLITDIIQEY